MRSTAVHIFHYDELERSGLANRENISFFRSWVDSFADHTGDRKGITFFRKSVFFFFETIVIERRNDNDDNNNNKFEKKQNQYRRKRVDIVWELNLSPSVRGNGVKERINQRLREGEYLEEDVEQAWRIWLLKEGEEGNLSLCIDVFAERVQYLRTSLSKQRLLSDSLNDSP